MGIKWVFVKWEVFLGEVKEESGTDRGTRIQRWNRNGEIKPNMFLK